MRILLLLLPILMSGQVQIKIWGINSGAICSGDSIEIAFTYTPPIQKDTINPTTFRLYRNQVINGTSLWIENYNYFYKLKKFGTIDTTYLLKVRTPIDFGPGTASLTTSIQLQSPPDYKTLWFANCINTTGIEELQLNIDTSYYRLFDPYKTRIEPIPGEILIQQVGTIRKKVFILE